MPRIRPVAIPFDGDFSKLPPTLKPAHMAGIEDVAVTTIWDRCRKQTMRPKPRRWWPPYRWDRSAVQAELGQTS